MPLKRGHSPEVVSANIKELVRSGHKPKQAVAIALASKRKYKKMAAGGELDEALHEGDVTDREVDEMSQRGMVHEERAYGGKIHHPDEHDMPHEYKQREHEMDSEHLYGGGMAKGGKLPKHGSGKRFEKLESSLSNQKGIKDPGALAASIGRKKFGSEKMAKLAAHGKKMAYGGMADGGPISGEIPLDPDKIRKFQQGSVFNPQGKKPVQKYRGGVMEHEEPDLDEDMNEGDHNEHDDRGQPGRAVYEMDEDREGLSDSVMLAEALNKRLESQKYRANQSAQPSYEADARVSGKHSGSDGYVQDGPEGDEPEGNKPKLDWMNDGSEEPMESEDKREGDYDEPHHPGRMSAGEHAKEYEPSGMGLSPEAKEAILRKKKSRRYGSYDPR